MSNAKQQGELDGLCGMYAIVNALRKMGVSREDEVFQTCCEALCSSRWPDTLWEGTTLRDIEVMLKGCRAADIKGVERITVSYPFRRTEPKSNKEFWDSFYELFQENRANKCAILGLAEPSLHWLVANPNGSGIRFTDSGVRKPVTVPQNMIYAGSRRSGKETHRIERKEVILFERHS
ncbi:hypothetical protein RM543_10335 [Roseicyclus sp. F158]|uniref:Uncharacterized protein n=1 Tax=Tropicimonas omnivorans TaxID=3075590 RepID=A0ABU3DHS3_9RHOB|nr:hypothetical protein [Roseicyclus sp. F158]MDT0683084.1 hypothetical protein [Roseicyclus sp. F158]